MCVRVCVCVCACLTNSCSRLTCTGAISPLSLPGAAGSVFSTAASERELKRRTNLRTTRLKSPNTWLAGRFSSFCNTEQNVANYHTHTHTHMYSTITCMYTHAVLYTHISRTSRMQYNIYSTVSIPRFGQLFYVVNLGPTVWPAYVHKHCTMIHNSV